MKAMGWTLLMGLMVVAGVARADSLYLLDGSVLNGVVLDETAEDLVIANDVYGELVILKSKVIYRDSCDEGVQTESFSVTPDGTAIVARLQRRVPRPLPEAGAVNQLVPGDVQSITTLKGQDVPFDKHLISDNSLVSIDASSIPNESEWVIMTSLQTTTLTSVDASSKRFDLKYQLNEKSHLKIVVRLPARAKIRSVSPAPQIQSAGLIVWDRTLERQQIFQPEIIFDL